MCLLELQTIIVRKQMVSFFKYFQINIKKFIHSDTHCNDNFTIWTEQHRFCERHFSVD